MAGKKNPLVSKVAKFENYQRYSGIINFYGCLYGVGQVHAHHHTNVCKISRFFGAVPSLALDVSPLNLLII